jgi:hypothetical protein
LRWDCHAFATEYRSPRDEAMTEFWLPDKERLYSSPNFGTFQDYDGQQQA